MEVLNFKEYIYGLVSEFVNKENVNIHKLSERMVRVLSEYKIAPDEELDFEDILESTLETIGFERTLDIISDYIN